MTLNERLKKVAVLGAGGKMGSGISLLLAQEMALQKLQTENRNQPYQLTLIDVNPNSLEGLQQYLKAQAQRFVKKNLDRLKELLPETASTDAIESQFVNTLLSILNPTTDLKAAKDSLMVFEAILEKIDLKVSVFETLKNSCGEETYFFSNTSSIPLHELDSRVGLDGRVIGFHFYNPPAVQKLVELIIPENIKPDLPQLSRELGKRLRKIIIPSNDIAGFIGNGHFIRDGLHGIAEAQRLAGEMSFPQAIYVINRISQNFLLRPMGIFQLIDYVGLDIFQSILKIMNPYFDKENLHSDLIDDLVSKGVKGGQFSDGSQKDGFLKYKNNKPTGVYIWESGDYSVFSESDWKTETEEIIGVLPEGHGHWKTLVKDPDRYNILKRYFDNLIQKDTLGAQLAVNYLQRSKEIGELLLSSGVANTVENINGVLMNGFYHLYGPINDFIPSLVEAQLQRKTKNEP